MKTHATEIRNGKLECREEWEELVGLSEVKGDTIHHIQWEDVGMWIDQQTVDDRLSELSMTVRDDFESYRDSFDPMENQLQFSYVE